MSEPDGHGSAPPDAGPRPIAAEFEVGEAGSQSAAEELAPEEAFQTLANEVRVTVLVRLLSAERAGEEPLPFSALQDAAESDSSARFAYHLRQLSGHFLRRVEDGYVLTPPGRRAAEAVVAGTFTDPRETQTAS